MNELLSYIKVCCEKKAYGHLENHYHVLKLIMILRRIIIRRKDNNKAIHF
jgi:hypothetical protein